MNLNEALKRLDAALTALEAAAARREEADRRSGDLETELSLMQDDRARLAVDLDGTIAKLDRMEATTADVGRRLELAMAAVQAVLDAETASVALRNDGD
ncbi:DUF4164 family protein [Chelatococcus reniformis]|uniref:DUF4164 family protein n=1 Tax=Chelatococcus reniformis TaxID=1494448 RepID=A0A916UAX5_9HYPH|nr:DUF4164 family protein [Chelatococcus reniformis]GGC64381.1 hypothetical protein GCM10010994_23730 [Chelatococcus reniformis]